MNINAPMSQTASLDLGRLSEHLDPVVIGSSHLAAIGVGGAVGAIETAVRSGVSNMTVVDPDIVGPTNLATQGYFADQIGLPKVDALRDNLLRINPHLRIDVHHAPYEELSAEAHEEVWKANIVLAMTDQHHVQLAINRDALSTGTDTIFAMMGDGLQQCEVTATFAEVVARGGGCHACHIWPRVKAYKNGFMNRAVIGSHVASASMLNAQIAYLTLARLHQRAGSSLAIGRLADRFASAPCLLTQLDPAFWSARPDVYGVVPDGSTIFTTRTFALDAPRGWVCEACGTEGVA